MATENGTPDTLLSPHTYFAEVDVATAFVMACVVDEPWRIRPPKAVEMLLCLGLTVMREVTLGCL